MREAGIDWSTFSNGTVQIQSFGASNVTNNFFRASYNATVRRVNVNALLRAFESLSRGEILARPQIRVMSGEEGKIKVGTNFFLTTVDFAGNLRFSEYEAGIILTVTPTVVGRNDSTFIHLDVKAERSDVTLAATNTSKNITESSTQVLLLDGEETAMAGLISTSQQTVRRGIPFLKDLPAWFFGLRYVFGYESVTRSKRELVVLLGARLVNPLLARRNTRIDMQDYLERQKNELKRLQRGGPSSPLRESSTRRVRSTSQKNR
jgi:type IV pilus assembly protein PilQ